VSSLSLGIINPLTYHDERIILVPFGIDSRKNNSLKLDDSPYKELGIKKDDFVLLWFGGLYPWFNFKPLLESIKKLSINKHFKFVLVGGKNPFNAHPDFVKQFEEVRNMLEATGLLGKSVHLIDWVDFEDRLKWYQGSNAVISINQPGNENQYSWRTRVYGLCLGKRSNYYKWRRSIRAIFCCLRMQQLE
jgi:glycosyltransferase involved in cell wall biosynthesis